MRPPQMLYDGVGTRRVIPILIQTSEDGLRHGVSVLVGGGGDEVEGHGARDGEELHRDKYGGEHDHAATDVGPLGHHFQAFLRYYYVSQKLSTQLLLFMKLFSRHWSGAYVMSNFPASQEAETASGYIGISEETKLKRE